MPIGVEQKGIPVHISPDLKTIGQAAPTTEPQVIKKDIFVLPAESPPVRWVEVHGFRNAGGGILSSILISDNDEVATLTLVPVGDKELPQGINEIKIDGVLYKALSMEESEQIS